MVKRMVNNKGQAAAAAALIAVIAAMIVLYIIFLQPEDRAELLGEDTFSSSSGRTSSLSSKNVTLLNESPGRIDFLSQKKIEHSIPTAHVFTQTEGAVLEQKDSMTVERSLFSSKDGMFEFSLADLSNTENVLLSFGVQEPRGQLIITLNDETIVDKEIITANIDPIALPSRALRESNTLTFQVSSPGIAFWRTNRYALVDVQVTGDVTEITARRSRSTFLVSSVEYGNLERIFLKFQPNCNSRTAGPITVYVNEFNIYSGVPDCGVQRLRLEIPITHIQQGENEVTFEIESGDYILSQIAIESELEQVDFPVYYFDLSEDQFRSVQNRTKDVKVRLDFVDTVDRKQGQFIVNGYVTGFDTKELSVEKDISEDLERGSNSVKIRPEKSLDVRKISVTLTSRR
ncbi:MAG TPA: hypothetical protein VJB66_00700 [Candidatus Nanoarchaeia archaeon]|nr:hypothetical protein [Candidatus Nanoarchaeia archaeon]